ncbi:MAG: N-acetylmuramoyl-L-alanine amidase [Gemmatimonadetes bacterium]|nr:N-acetylmuramoyl-L-alanine amidase [Gemmatimonadota bacterium]
MRGLWLLAAAVLLPLPAERLPGQDPGAAWRVVTDRGVLAVRQVRHGSFDALPLATLVSVGAEVSYGRGDVVEVRVGASALRFRVGSPDFALGDSTFHLEGAVYEDRGAVYLPVGFFRDFLPRASAGRVAVDARTLEIRGSMPQPQRVARRETSVFESVKWAAPDTTAPTPTASPDTAAGPDPLAALIAVASGPTDTASTAAESAASSEAGGGTAGRQGGEAPLFAGPVVSTGTLAGDADAPSADGSAAGTGDAWRGRRRLVVVDAGHGGVDPGARGPGGTREKDVTLAVARRLAALLRRDSTLEVRMTRDRDTLIALGDRPRFANGWRQRGQPAVFISVHCNANPSRSARGIETYFLAEAKTEDARRVEAMENAAQRFETGSGPSNGAGLGFILHDLRQNQYLRESSDWAELIDGRLAAVAGPSRGVRQAGFAVLNGAFMPAVLVEIGFISNPVEEQRLSDADHQDDIAGQLATSVRAFLDRSERHSAPTAGR